MPEGFCLVDHIVFDNLLVVIEGISGAALQGVEVDTYYAHRYTEAQSYFPGVHKAPVEVTL